LAEEEFDCIDSSRVSISVAARVADDEKDAVQTTNKARQIGTMSRPEREEKAWSLMHSSLCTYAEAKRQQSSDGSWDGNIPARYITNTTPPLKLGKWVSDQRTLKRKGVLRKDREERLGNIGLKWQARQPGKQVWSDMYAFLCEYAEEKMRESGNGSWNGHIPQRYETNTVPPRKLGRWVNNQRTAKAKGRLEKEREAKLERLGLKWNIRK
jgi:hypothetical protein